MHLTAATDKTLQAVNCTFNALSFYHLCKKEYLYYLTAFMKSIKTNLFKNLKIKIFFNAKISQKSNI